MKNFQIALILFLLCTVIYAQANNTSISQLNTKAKNNSVANNGKLDIASKFTPIAYYGLYANSKDSMNNYSDMDLMNVTYYYGGGIYCNGIYENMEGGYHALTPSITGLDFNNFSVSAEFQIEEYPKDYMPIIVGGNLYRWMSVYLSSEGYYSLRVNNGSVSFTTKKKAILNAFTRILISYDQTHNIQLAVNDTVLISTNIDLETGDNKIFTTLDYSNGGAFKGFIRELKIYGESQNQAYLNLLSPNGGEFIKVGSTFNIAWYGSGLNTVKIEYSADNGTNWTSIVESTSLSNYPWVVPNTLSAQCIVRVTNTANASMSDVSDAVFSIIKPNPIPETEPNNTIAQAMSVSYLDTVDAGINPINDIDYYKLNGVQGDTLQVYAAHRNNSGLYGRVTLIDQNGNSLIKDNSFIQDPRQQRIVYVLPSTGTYYIRYSFQQNWDGIPAKEKEEYEREQKLNAKLLKGPQLDYNQGDYRIAFTYFKKSAPIFDYTYITDLNYNSTRFYVSLYPNGLDTKVKIDYGTTTSYGNSLIATTNANSLNQWWFTSDKITGLQANTTYHYKITLENAKGITESGDQLLITPDAPQGWELKNIATSNQLYDIDFLDANNGVAVSNGYKEIYKTTDGGKTWSNVCPSSVNYFDGMGIDYVSANKIVAVGSPILISNDGGTTWNTINQVGGWSQSKVSFINESTGLMVNQGGAIYKTTDGGSTWTEKYNANYGAFGWSVKFFNSNLAVVVGGNGYVLKTIDGGETWNDVFSDSNNPLFGVDIIDENTYVVCGSYILAKTINGGSSWTVSSPSAYFYDVKFSDASNGKLVGSTVFTTKDGGASWAEEKTGTANELYGITQPSSGSYFAVGDWGTLLKSQDYLKVASPNGGEHLKIGSTYNITWAGSGVTNVKIEYSTNNGTSWTKIIASTPAGTGSYLWTVPNLQSSQCLVRVTNTANASMSDISDGVFSIINAGPIAETEPNNTIAQAMSVSYSDTVDAGISPVNDIDYYKLNGVQGDTLQVYAENRNGSQLDGMIRLLDNDANELISNDDFIDISKSRLLYVLPYSGNYYIRYAYYNNSSGVSAKEEKNFDRKQKENPNSAKGPQLSSTQGDYRIAFTYFKKSAPIFYYSYTTDLNYNSTRLTSIIYPNGLDTKINIDYGTTTSYGSSLVVTTNANGLNSVGYTSGKITGLQANTTYHYKVILESAKGVTESGDKVFVTLSQPEGWVIINSGTTNTLRGIKFYNENIGYAVGGNIILKTTDGGLTWVNKKTSGDYNALEVIDANNVIAVGYNQQVSKTTDGGETWTDSQPTGCYGIMSVSFKDANNGVIVTYCGDVYKTTDGGNSWNSLTVGVEHSDLYAVKYFSNNTIIAAGYNRYVIKSTDGGTNWTSQQLNGNSYLFNGLSFKDINNGLLVGWEGMIFKTTDSGTTWSSINSGNNNSFYGVSYSADGTAYSVDDYGAIYNSKNDGSTWTQIQSGTTNSLYNVCNTSKSTYVVGDWGTLLKSQDYLKVASPNGGENFKAGSQKNITWSYNGVKNVKIEFSSNNGKDWTDIVASTLANNSYLWTVPNTLSNQCKIKITDVLNANLSDESDGAFRIYDSTGKDTVFIDGGTLAQGENSGLLETIINGDTTSTGERENPDRVYALSRGKVYFQNSPIKVVNPEGTLTIVAAGDKSLPKPIIIMMPINDTPISTNYGATSNLCYGSIEIVGVHWQTMQLDATQNNELFMCGTKNQLPQSLTIDNCLFEFSNIDLFDCTDESGAIGGWPYGAKFKITNSYFRNLFFSGQWWGSRIFQCRHPLDTLWIENNTIHTGGLTFLMQNSLTKFAYINHNTIVNNKKYWLLSPYYVEFYVTNNIFINQNWVGEDINVANSGQDPDKRWMSTICIDTTNSANSTVQVQSEFGSPGYYSDAVSLKNMKVYVSNNVNYSDPLLNEYYTNKNGTGPYASGTNDRFPHSYLTWSFSEVPFAVHNIPSEWMNDRTLELFDKYSPATKNSSAGCGFVEENTIIANPNTVTPGIADASVVEQMAAWNQNQYGDANFPSSANDILHSAYIAGDYDPTTIPGYKTEDGSGITKFTDLIENYSQSTYISTIDNLPIGSLIWNDAQNTAYNSNAEYLKVKAAYTNSLQGEQSEKINIQVSNKGNADNQALSFGTSESATDGIDTYLGEAPLPPMPPLEQFDARFELPVTPAEYSYKDYRALGQEKITWKILFQAGSAGYPVTIKWDKSQLPEGSFIIEDCVTGTIINTNMKSVDSLVVSSSGITLLKIEYSKNTGVDISLQKGWNMVSVPVEASDMQSTTLFNGKNSNVFGFENGYKVKDTLSVGEGYWVRYGTTDTVNVYGVVSGLSTIPLKSGWNMIGPYERKVVVSGVSTTPSGIITSQFFGFSNGYKITDTLKVGQGYWVRVSQNGELNIGGGALAKAGHTTLASELIDTKWGRITITDKQGNMSQLYVSADGLSLSSYDLPPAPPSGIPDVRWETNRTVEVLSGEGRDILLSGMNYPLELRVSGMNLLIKDKSGSIEKLIRDGENVTIGSLEVERLTASTVEIPKSYELYQNYPNPFNPTTKIKFGLPDKVKVKLEVYNVLGQRVEVLLDKELDAGYHEVEWKAMQYASGMYIYRISAGSFTDVKKLMLMK